MLTYERNKKYWNEVFRNETGNIITTKSIGHEEVDKDLDWLCQDSDSILDFGCGNGVWLFRCFLRGTSEHIGIDISEEGIRVAEEIHKIMKKGKFTFAVGGVEVLGNIPDTSVDGAILSNILDNLIPSDAVKTLAEIKRVVKPGGKILVKLNPYITDEQIKEWNIKIIEGNFLDDGLFLWNRTTDEWKELFKKYYRIISCKEIYYPEYEQYNRLFYCVIIKINIMTVHWHVFKVGFYVRLEKRILTSSLLKLCCCLKKGNCSICLITGCAENWLWY